MHQSLLGAAKINVNTVKSLAYGEMGVDRRDRELGLGCKITLFLIYIKKEKKKSLP